MANIYTVEQINNYIKGLFGTDPLLNKVSVKGEISNCKYSAPGHIYFTLKYNDQVLSAVMFAGNRRYLDFKLENGMQVVCTGRIDVYVKSGQYQIYVEKVARDGMGELYERFEKLKKDLAEMGMFDKSYKKPIPKFVKKLGVVTASTGAAIQDIINVSTRRNPGIQIVLFPAAVQGEYAVDSICRGIKALDEYGVDCMIVGRGGGSIEDLWAFNEEKVARAIFECNTPIISAVGHETDFTIADFVSDLRAPTPSAAAEIAVFDQVHLMQRVIQYSEILSRRMDTIMEGYRNRLEMYRVKLEHLSPASVLKERRSRLTDMEARMKLLMDRVMNDKRNALSMRCARLEALSPMKKMSGGYSYTADSRGKAVTSVLEVQPGDEVRINVVDGCISATVAGTEQIQRNGQ